MNRERIWDVPTRLIHWLLAAALVGAFVVGKLFGKHSSVFEYHAIIGLVAGLALVLRLAWGIVGTRHARFSSYVFSPAALVRYVRGVFTNDPTQRYDGHNPATSWAAPVMFGLFVVVLATGLFIGNGVEAAEELHELSVYALLAVVGVHVLGVAIHIARRRENLLLGMIDGRKPAEASSAIRSSRPLVGLLVLIVIGAFSTRLIANYDPVNHHTHLPLLGTTIGLGEAEGEGGAVDRGARRHGDDD